MNHKTTITKPNLNLIIFNLSSQNCSLSTTAYKQNITTLAPITTQFNPSITAFRFSILVCKRASRNLWLTIKHLERLNLIITLSFPMEWAITTRKTGLREVLIFQELAEPRLDKVA